MAANQDLQMKLTRLYDLIDSLPEYVVEPSEPVDALFAPLLLYAAASKPNGPLIHPVGWKEVRFRLGKLETWGSWTARGKVGLTGLWDVLDYYGCWKGTGYELEAQSWCDKITVAVESQLVACATVEPLPSSPSSLPETSLGEQAREGAGPSGANPISSSAGLPGIQAAPHNSPTISHTTISSSFCPRDPLPCAPSDQSSTSQKASTSRSESTPSESALSNLIGLSSPDTSDDELVVTPLSSSAQFIHTSSEGKDKGKGKAREQLPESEPRPSIRRRSTCPTPNSSKKPRLELATTEAQPAQPEDGNSKVLSTEDRIRIALPLPANLDLTSFENPWPDRDLSFTRREIGGSEVPALSRNTKLETDFLCIHDGLNIAPMRAGECGAFFSSKNITDKLGKWNNFPVFVAGSSSCDWQYRGQYDVVFGGFTAPGGLKGMNASRKDEVQKVLQGHRDSKGDWWKGLRQDWRINSTTVGGGLDELDRGNNEAGMRYVILKCRGFNEEFYNIWNRRRSVRKSGKSGVAEVAMSSEGRRQDLEEDSDSDVEILSGSFLSDMEREDQEEGSGQNPAAIEVRRSGRKSGPNLSRYSPNP